LTGILRSRRFKHENARLNMTIFRCVGQPRRMEIPKEFVHCESSITLSPFGSQFHTKKDHSSYKSVTCYCAHLWVFSVFYLFLRIQHKALCSLVGYCRGVRKNPIVETTIEKLLRTQFVAKRNMTKIPIASTPIVINIMTNYFVCVFSIIANIRSLSLMNIKFD